MAHRKNRHLHVVRPQGDTTDKIVEDLMTELRSQNMSEEPVPVEKVGKPVVDERVHARVEQKNLQPAPGRRIAGLIGPQGLA